MVCVYNKLTHLEQKEIDGYDYYDRLFQERFVFLIIDYINSTYKIYNTYDDLTNCEYEFDDYKILKLSNVCYTQFLQNKYSIDISDYIK
jgi:hypothetical protein